MQYCVFSNIYALQRLSSLKATICVFLPTCDPLCLLVGLLICWHGIGKSKFDLHEVRHGRSVSAPNVTIAFWEDSVKDQDKNRHVLKIFPSAVV